MPLLLRLLHRMANLTGLFLIIVWWDSAFAAGCRWQIAPEDLVTPAQREWLQKKYPRIDNSEQTFHLLNEISKMKSLIQMVVRYEGDLCIFSGMQAATIQDISISLTTRMFKSALETRMHRYRGWPDSPTLREQIRFDIATYLRSRGFLRSRVVIESRQGNDGQVALSIQVDENYPCYISKIVSNFVPPPSLRQKIQKGDVCDNEVLQQALVDMENKIKDLGYNRHQALKAEFEYNKSDSSALLRIEGDLGKRVKYSIISPVKNLLAGQIADLDSSIIDPDIMRTEILRDYRNEGYDDATIEYMGVRETGEDEITHVFKVTPGMQYFVAQVQIEGISAFTANECLGIMHLDTIVTLNSVRLNSDFIRKGVDSLVAEYNRKGYWNTQIHYPRVTKNPLTGETKLVYNVQEGLQRVYQGIRATGNTVVGSDEIEQLFGKERDAPLVWQDLVDFEKQLKLLYLKKGYIHSKFKFELVEHESYKKIQVVVALAITENNRMQIGEITITGLVTTHPKVVRRELRFVSGDWYDPDAIEKSRKALLATGLFSTVDILPTDSESFAEEARKIDYTVAVREAKPGTVSFGPGFSIDEGARFEIESAYKNIGGVGRQVFAKGTLSEERLQQYIGRNTILLGRTIGVGYIEPYIGGLPMNGTVKVNHQALAGTDWEISRSGEVSLSHTLRHFLPETELAGFYGQKITQVRALALYKTNLIDTGDVRTGRIGLRWNADKRNNIAWPTAGYIISTEVSWARYAFGGDLKYDKWMFTHSAYHGFTDNLVFALGYQLTAFENVGREGDRANVLPTSERLYTGGAESNRGFAQNNLGPIVSQYNDKTGTFDNIVVGGSRRAVYKLELRYQFAKDFLAASVFMDASNDFFSPSEKRIFNETFAQTTKDASKESTMYDNDSYPFEQMLTHPADLWYRNYVSSGLALNLLTPLGAVNLSYGIPVKRYAGRGCPADQCIPRGHTVRNVLTDGVFHVNVGATF